MERCVTQAGAGVQAHTSISQTKIVIFEFDFFVWFLVAQKTDLTSCSGTQMRHAAAGRITLSSCLYCSHHAPPYHAATQLSPPHCLAALQCRHCLVPTPRCPDTALTHNTTALSPSRPIAASTIHATRHRCHVAPVQLPPPLPCAGSLPLATTSVGFGGEITVKIAGWLLVLSMFGVFGFSVQLDTNTKAEVDSQSS
jgi:hypothetical protein